MATAAEMRRRREALGHRIKELLREGYTLEQAAKSEGLTIKTCSAYWALAQAPAAVRDLYRDGRLPLDAVAMIADPALALAPGTQRRLAEMYIREKAERSGKFQPADFRLVLDEFICKLAEAPPRLTQTSLVNDDEDPDEVIALERAEKALTRARLVDLERDVATAIRLLTDPRVAECVTARIKSIPGWTREVKRD